MATRTKKLLIWMLPLHFKFVGWFCHWYSFNSNLMVSNNILAFFYRLIKFYFITVYTKVRVLKVTIVAYAFSVQYFHYSGLCGFKG